MENKKELSKRKLKNNLDKRYKLWRLKRLVKEIILVVDKEIDLIKIEMAYKDSKGQTENLILIEIVAIGQIVIVIILVSKQTDLQMVVNSTDLQLAVKIVQISRKEIFTGEMVKMVLDLNSAIVKTIQTDYKMIFLYLSQIYIKLSEILYNIYKYSLKYSLIIFVIIYV